MIVFDASTLILLAKAELLERFLQDFPGQITIPKEVERECCGATKSLDALLIRKAINEKRIRVNELKNRKLRDRIEDDFPVGTGEAEAIALALSLNADLVAIDDKHGINACKLLGISFTTAINILLRMHENGLIEKEEALFNLEALERHGRYKAEIVKDARGKLEGR